MALRKQDVADFALKLQSRQRPAAYNAVY